MKSIKSELSASWAQCPVCKKRFFCENPTMWAYRLEVKLVCGHYAQKNMCSWTCFRRAQAVPRRERSVLTIALEGGGGVGA